MSWFEKLMPSRISTEQRTRSVPEGVWIKCQKCDAQLYRTELERNLNVCPKCDYHMRIGARTRLDYFLDPDTQEEIAAGLESLDPLRFRDTKKYRDRLAQAQKKTGEKDALVTVKGRLLLVHSSLVLWVARWAQWSASDFAAPPGIALKTGYR